MAFFEALKASLPIKRPRTEGRPAKIYCKMNRQRGRRRKRWKSENQNESFRKFETESHLEIDNVCEKSDLSCSVKTCTGSEDGSRTVARTVERVCIEPRLPSGCEKKTESIQRQKAFLVTFDWFLTSTSLTESTAQLISPTAQSRIPIQMFSFRSQKNVTFPSHIISYTQ